MFHFGFSYIGLLWLLMLFVPNIIWTKNKPSGYEESVKKENKVLLLFEKIGQALVTVLVLIFSDFNIVLSSRSVSSLIILGISFLLMVFHELYWIRYFKSERTMKDFYSSFLGVPVAGATLPVLAFFVLGIYGSNSLLMLAVTILGIGHIGIHLKHRNESVGKKKRVLPVRILKVVGAVIGCAFVLASTAYFGIKNVKFAKAFAGAPNPVFEDKYIDLNGQEQFIRVLGRDVNNPVIILLHGGPGGPDGMMDYSYMDYLLDDYTYITWDQRGCGRTYYKNKNLDANGETATVEQLLEDIDALADYACDRFGKEKVTVLGHSWGTVLAVRYSLLHPEKIEKTICIGQVANFVPAEEEGYKHARSEALKAGDDVTALDAAFEAFREDPGFTITELRSLTAPYNTPDVPQRAFIHGAFSPYLGIDDMRWMFIDNSSSEKMYERYPALLEYFFWGEVANDIRIYGTDFEVPVYFISGEQDYTCATSYARKYYEDITAPDKAFYEIKGCGHTPQADKPEEVANIIAELNQ